MNPFEEGYNANSAYENPYWKSYPKDNCPLTEQFAARQWVDGYVEKIIDNNYIKQQYD